MSRPGSPLRTCGGGELVGKRAAQSRILSRGEGVTAYVDDREGVRAELVEAAAVICSAMSTAPANGSRSSKRA